MKSFKKIDVEGGNKVQDNIQNALTPVLNKQILDGLQLTGIRLVAGQVNSIEHKLGRALIGYIITRKSANSNIWDSQDANRLSNLTLALLCSVDCTVDIWVY